MIGIEPVVAIRLAPRLGNNPFITAEAEEVRILEAACEDLSVTEQFQWLRI